MKSAGPDITTNKSEAVANDAVPLNKARELALSNTECRKEESTVYEQNMQYTRQCGNMHMRVHTYVCMKSVDTEQDRKDDAYWSNEARVRLSDYVTAEDGCETTSESYLVSCVKVRRPPEKCVVFEDDQWGDFEG